jgi:hypothetical protein
MSDPGKVIVAMSFFATVTYIVRLMVLRAPWPTFGETRPGSNVVVDADRMARLEQAVEAIALEVERISEGQRFTTKLLSDRATADRLSGAPSLEPRHVTPH